MTDDTSTKAVTDNRLAELIHVAQFSAFKASAMHELETALRELQSRRLAPEPAPATNERSLLIEAEALLCDERGGITANELAARIRLFLFASQKQPSEPAVKRPTVDDVIAVLTDRAHALPLDATAGPNLRECLTYNAYKWAISEICEAYSELRDVMDPKQPETKEQKHGQV